MTQKLDDGFFERATAIIDMMNAQAKDASPRMVNGSVMLASARYGAWLSAIESGDAKTMRAERDAYIAAMSSHYRNLLEGQFDEYVENYEAYMSAAKTAGE